MSTNFISLLTDIVSTPGMPLRIGTMIATAILIGFVLIDNYNVMVKIVMAVFIFIAFQEWIRYAIILAFAPETHPTNLAIYTTILAAVFFAIGIGVGAGIGVRARRKENAIISAGDHIIKQIDNGGFAKEQNT